MRKINSTYVKPDDTISIGIGMHMLSHLFNLYNLCLSRLVLIWTYPIFIFTFSSILFCAKDITLTEYLPPPRNSQACYLCSRVGSGSRNGWSHQCSYHRYDTDCWNIHWSFPGNSNLEIQNNEQYISQAGYKHVLTQHAPRGFWMAVSIEF